jgi:hypothetical protein
LPFICISQPILATFDSIPIQKSGDEEIQFKIDHPLIKTATLKLFKPHKEKNNISHIMEDIGETMFAEIFGNWHSWQDMNFRIPCSLDLSRKDLSWKVNLYAYGNLEKDMQKKQVFTNKKILIRNKIARIDWNSDSWCIVLEEGKIIGGLTIRLNPLTDSIFLKSASFVPGYQLETQQNQASHPFDLVKYAKTFGAPEYGAIGTLHDKPVMILYYAIQKKIWIFQKGEPIAQFHMESVSVEILQENGKNRYIAHHRQPELKIQANKRPETQAEIIRLALLGRLLAWVISNAELDF